MQAVILAAGMGKRLQKLTKDRTKCMIHVGEKMIIDRMLNELTTLNIQRIIIVTGHGAELLKKHLSSYYFNNIEIQFIHNDIYSTTNNIYSLSLVKQQLKEDDTIILESDIVFEKGVLQDLFQLSDPNVAVIAKYEPWMEGTMVEIDEENNIINMIPGKYVDIKNTAPYYKTVNIYKFNKEFLSTKYIPFLEAYLISYGQNQYYEQVLSILMSIERTHLKGLVLRNKKWYEIDDQQDLAVANVLFSKDSDALSKYLSCYGGYWRFPALIDFCYLVNPYFPSEKLLDDIKFMSNKLLTSYPSGRDVNDSLVSGLFDVNKKYICVGNGASELIKILCRSLKGKTGIIYPSFEEYHNSLHQNDIVHFDVSDRNFSYSVSDIMDYYDNENIENLLLINPDNPSGNYLTRSEMNMLLEWAKLKKIKVIYDESFIDFSDHDDDSLLNDEILEKYKNLIIIKSIAKSYGVPGIRLGIIATSNEILINRTRKELPIWNINSYAEYFLQIIKRYIADFKSSCLQLAQERKRFFCLLNEITYLRIYPSQANYFLCEVLSPLQPSILSNTLLLDYNILIKDCSQKIGMNNYNFIRVAIRDTDDNNKLIDALNNINV